MANDLDDDTPRGVGVEALSRLFKLVGDRRRRARHALRSNAFLLRRELQERPEVAQALSRRIADTLSDLKDVLQFLRSCTQAEALKP